MLICVFCSILTRNLKKRFEVVFEKILKMSGGLHVKYPQILNNFFQNLKALTKTRSTSEYPFGRNRTYDLGASSVRRLTDRQTDRRTFSFQLVFRYQGPTK